MTEAVHTLPELARLAQIEYRTAHVWMKRGLLTPSIRATEGTGHPALFSQDDVKRAITLRVLRRWLSLEGLAAANESPASRSHLQKVLGQL